MNFELTLPQQIIFGEGTIKQVGEQAKRLGKWALIVTSEGMRERECLKQIANGMNSVVYPRVKPDPTQENVFECDSFARKKDLDLVIGLGGGSVMDVAKQVATNLGLPKIMIPTTAGSGSEVTHEVVFRANGKKQGITDKALVADVVIVDPDLLKTLPQRRMVISAIDALAHSVESYQAKRGNQLTKDLAYDAWGLIEYGLRWWNTKIQNARVQLAMGSLLAGLAFGNSGTTLCHALSYPLSNRGMPHGEAVAVMLPYAIEFNNYESGLKESALNKGRITRLNKMVAGIDIKVNFDSDIEEMAREVMEDERHLSNNPREVRFEDVVKIYKEMFECVTAK